MKNKSYIPGIAAFIAMLILILDSQTAFSGAKEGVNLCIQVIIPSLFPFFLISVMLIHALSGADLPLMKPLGRALGIPVGSEPVIIPAFLGGYPTGAQCITSYYQSGQLSKHEAERLLGFCNNAGPAFLFGMSTTIFPYRWIPWALWLVHIASAIFAALLLPSGPNTSSRSVHTDKPVPSQALQIAMRSMATVCGWVILFRIVIIFFNRWLLWMLPKEVQILATGLLELSNGCLALADLSDYRIQFVFCSLFLSFGGLCVAMQTRSITEGLSLRYYFAGKSIQAFFSLIFSLALFWPAAQLSLIIFAFPLLLRTKKIDVAFRRHILYTKCSI